eukprot:m.32375 g.32375  ORF g.32375 m.32375 type:complete len:351 (-) comp8403_c0_seq1:233-1285(-)
MATKLQTEWGVPGNDEAATTLTFHAKDGAVMSYEAEEPPADLYSPPESATTESLITNIAHEGLASVQAQHIKAYNDIGYLVVRNTLSAEEVRAALDTIDTYCREQETPFYTACEKFQEELKANPDPDRGARGEDGPGIQFEAKAAGLGRNERGQFVRKLKNFHVVNEKEPLGNIGRDAEMQKFLGKLINGDENEAMDIFQSSALLKPALVGREKPWHQDHAYFNVDIEKSKTGGPTNLVGIWIALDKATVENGCMHVIANKHKESIIHFQRRDWQICDKEVYQLGDIVPVVLNPGDMLVFSSLTPHGTPPNKSSKTRRAVQFHFLPKDTKKNTTEARLSMFGKEGKGVEC